LKLTGEVHVPPAVTDELSRLAPNWSSLRPEWIHETPLIAPYDTQAAPLLLALFRKLDI